MLRAVPYLIYACSVRRASAWKVQVLVLSARRSGKAFQRQLLESVRTSA